MAELQFSRKELEDLARKVGTLQPFLSDKERELLLAIFASAEHHVTVSPTKPDHGAFDEVKVLGQELTEDENPTLGDLQRQLLNSYIPGNTQPETGTPLGLTAKVTGLPPPPATSTPGS